MLKPHQQVDGSLESTLDLCATPRCEKVSISKNKSRVQLGGKAAFVFLWLFAVADFARPEDIFGIPFHFQLIFGTAAAVAYLGALAAGRVTWSWSRELILVLLLTVWFILGIPFAFWRGGSFEVLTQVWLKTVLAFVLLSQILTSIERVKKLLWAIILSEFVVTCISIAMSHRADLKVGDRLFGVSAGLLGWNYFGIAVAQICPYMAALYVCRRSRIKTVLLAATIGAMMWMLVLTASRGGVLNVLVSVILTCWFLLRGSARGRIACLVVAFCMLIAVAKAPDVFFLRVQTIWNNSDSAVNETIYSADESKKSREFLLERAIMYTLQNPIFGIGIGNFRPLNGSDLARSDAWLVTHNTFTEISSEAGIPALVFFLLLLATVVGHMRKVSRSFSGDPDKYALDLLARATLVSSLSLAFGWFFASMAYDRYSYYSAGIAAGLWALSRRQLRVRKRQPAAKDLPRPVPSTNWCPKSAHNAACYFFHRPSQPL